MIAGSENREIAVKYIGKVKIKISDFLRFDGLSSKVFK